ncbi:hypothetical protein RRU94_06830 [Domibacillus sp. DTU_2020_1001157_1_SI_ALB_TIR_016]|uniref:hypothetical protein n=1 Tax=Domibacillus sp. DTU_2020_1001157_1_SI_ALB_TIR_016 TaxID=3077789 RepID=UPI0028E200AF|nr:hypothetical protein [Domibacillus sp. DTU_2020_1001157_1_SI_ALB_TIR_016]WNS78174.1 hypothetical protein RRU94_06830 [Domibacillus sp. DTU_2020_1001157_1_SI_ALB_TIR_016]
MRRRNGGEFNKTQKQCSRAIKHVPQGGLLDRTNYSLIMKKAKVDVLAVKKHPAWVWLYSFMGYQMGKSAFLHGKYIGQVQEVL